MYCLLHVASTGEVDPAATDPFAGLMLELSTSEHVEPTGTIYLPRQPGTFGPLKMYTTDLFVEYLLDMPSLTDPTLSVRKVHIRVQNFEDFLPSIVKVIGVEFSIGDDDDSGDDDANAAVIADEGDHDVVLDGDVANGDQSDQHSSSCSNALCDPPTLDGTAQVDLLAFLETDSSEQEPPKKRSKNKLNKCEDPKRDLCDEGDVKEPTKISLLDDPCLESFLSEGDMVAFRDVENLCSSVHALSNIYERRATTVDLDDAKSDSDEEAVVDAGIFDAAAEPASSSTAASSSSFLSQSLHCCIQSYDS